jgi:hypothetical protein
MRALLATKENTKINEQIAKTIIIVELALSIFNCLVDITLPSAILVTRAPL